MLRKGARLAAIAGVLLLLSSAASANLITGTTSLGFGQVGVSIYGIDFFSFDGGNAQCDVPGQGSGCFDILSGTGSFAGLVNFNAPINAIKDLAAPPLSGPISVNQFVSFDSGAVTFDLVSVAQGGGPNCASIADLTAPRIACSIYADYGSPGNPNVQVSPFLLTNGPDGSTVGVSATMYFNGYSGDTASGTSPYVGIFSTQLAGTNIANIYSVISVGGTGTSSWSASFAPYNAPSNGQVPSAPEPDSWILAGTGVLFLCASLPGIRRRRK